MLFSPKREKCLLKHALFFKKKKKKTATKIEKELYDYM